MRIAECLIHRASAHSMGSPMHVTKSPEYPYALLDRPDADKVVDVVTPPLARNELTGPRAIRHRMADDIAELIRERGEDAVITVADLVALGWTRPQALDHGTAAAALATSDEKEPA